VSADWSAPLPREKRRVFESIVFRWETSFAMLSIALHDALTFRTRGQLICARQQVSVASELLTRLSRVLIASCEALADHARHLSDLPPVRPLKTEFFRGDTGQSAASWNGILHQVLFAERSRFFHKLRILASTLERLDAEFAEVASDLNDGIAVEPAACWGKLDSLHFDLNTCLREAEVVLKSFVRSLPSEMLPAFAAALERTPPAKPVRVRPRPFRVPA